VILGEGASKHEARRVKVASDSNVLKVGMGRFVGDVLVPCSDPRHGYVAGLQCLHRKVWISTAAGRCHDAERAGRMVCSKSFLGSWLDICIAYSSNGISWQSITNPDPDNENSTGGTVANTELEVPYDHLDHLAIKAPPLKEYFKLPDAVVQGPADSYVQVLPPASSAEKKEGEPGSMKGYVLFARRNFPTAWPEHARKWRGARGLRILNNPAEDLRTAPSSWILKAEMYLDMQWGQYEVHRRQVYGLTVTRYAGVHIGLMGVLEWPRHMHGPGDLLGSFLSTSRDGVHFDLRWVYKGEPLIRRGPPGRFDAGCIQAKAQFVTTGGHHWVFFFGRPGRHDQHQGDSTAIGLGRWRQDGFAYLIAGEEAGVVTTRPFVVHHEATSLEVNIMLGSQANVAMEVLDAQSGKALSGFDRGNFKPFQAPGGLNEKVWWYNQNVATLRGLRIVIRFHMLHARLYAFQFFR